MILLITRRDDLTADFLIDRLLTRGVRYLRFDVDHYLDDVCLSAEFDDQGIRGEIITPQGSASFSDIRGIWYRRAMAPTLSNLNLSRSDRIFAERESRHFLEGAIGAIPARWVNPWPAVHLWERKLGQLPLAAACGFKIPRAVVSTDAHKLSDFAAQNPVIVKSIGQGLHLTESGAESIYTHSAPNERLADCDAARLCPTLVQERIAKIADVRLTVIGDHLFAARLDADLPDGLDWRRPGTPVNYSSIVVPDHIAGSVKTIMQRMGLRYGAFDFALLRDGSWIFLEVNPAGEFAWIEEKLGFPIRNSLINELLPEDLP
jgi:glutathione synthase/RimK-type ligase-like ATP-grasp enzyme